MCRYGHEAAHEGHHLMTTRPKHPHDDAPAPGRSRTDGVLPLAIRQRLWDQLWARLLAPPVDPADRAPTPDARPRDPEQW